MKDTTKLLYMEDSYQRECKAVVKSVKEKNGTAEIILSETIFYPQGGGQPCDQGMVKGKNGELKVTNVAYNNGNPLHQGKLKGEIKEGDEVNCAIDWNRRYKNMRVHSAGHLVHEVVHEAKPQLKPIKGQHRIGGQQFIEYEGEAIMDRISLNMRLAQLINEPRQIKTYFVTLAELKKKAQFVPENLPTNKPLRVMEIDGYQPVSDGGTQVKSTEELDGTSITNIESVSGLIRVHYGVVSGTRIIGVSRIKKPAIKKTSEFQSAATTVFSQESYLNLKNNAIALITGAEGREELEELRVKYLGRKGEINRMLAEIPKMAGEEKIRVGEAINDLKRVIEEAISAKGGEILEMGDSGWTDLTAPGKDPKLGRIHPVTTAIDEITRIFERIGFTRVRYPTVDWDWYPFGSLNMEHDHPARDEWETFFVDAPAHPKLGKMVLTPHTSNGQVREMERVGSPPIRMLNIAPCFRRQQDVTHLVSFIQFEGLVVDKGISIVHLKGVLDYFAAEFYGRGVKSRLRPFHFQFTEPSFEVDFSCPNCKGTGKLGGNTKCRFCKSGWHEVGGAGMVHPAVLKNGGINPEKYTGFAFGWGLERTFALKPGVEIYDIRLLNSTDLRVLKK
jgi:phenylalanyl-tRNA synthetase alpha chain